MNKRKFKYLFCVVILGVIMFSNKAEATLEGQGNVTVEEEQIVHMNEDVKLLENKVEELADSVYEKSTIQGNKRKDMIKSRGNINFENGKVLLQAQDLIYLADEIDKLENNYKCNLIDALNNIGTYFRKDGSVTYDSNQSETNTSELKTSISLGCILQGIIDSQSVETIKQLQAVNGEQKLLFYQNEEAKNNKENLNITTTNTGLPLYYKEAMANNLSAGCSAWVNGVLVKGNGEDNRISWQNGYNEGYSRGMAESLDKVNVVYNYHKHTDQDGECYGQLTGMTPRICGCRSYNYTNELPGYEGIATCSNCKHNHPGFVCQAVRGYDSYTYIGLVCGKTEQTIESATIMY